jgi:hypothetical protein
LWSRAVSPEEARVTGALANAYELSVAQPAGAR